MANLAQERFRTGNHVAVFAEGDPIPLGFGVVGGRMAAGTSIQLTQDTGARPVHVVGDPEPQDIVDGAHTYEITLASLMLRDLDAGDRISAGRVDIHLLDRMNGKTVRKAEGCQLTNGSDQIPANQLVATNLRFAAMRIR